MSKERKIPIGYEFTGPGELPSELDRWTAIDMFCGAGGVTTGLEQARVKRRKIVDTIAAINHDPLAIKTHSVNHKKVLHFNDDITTQEVTLLPKCNILWASIECTNFSNAKGGKPRDADSRALAKHIPKYVKHCEPDYVIIENVREFMSWGPLDKRGKPISKTKGKSFLKWIRRMCGLGYRYEHRLLNSANYGAYTSRLRYFGIFAKYNIDTREGMPIAFPEATHSKDPDKSGRASGKGLKKWKAVKEKLDLQNEGFSIFPEERAKRGKKPLKPNTWKRVEFGVMKFCIGGELDEFLMKYYGTGGNCQSMEEPAGVIRTKDTFQKVKVETDENFIIKWFGNETNIKANAKSVNDPLTTITPQGRLGKVKVELDKQFITQNIQRSINANSVDNPLGSILTRDEKVLVTVEGADGTRNVFLTKYYGGVKHGADVNGPAHTITPIDHHALVTVKPGKFIVDYQYNTNAKDINNPAPTLVTNDRHAIASVELKEQFIKGDYNNGGGKASSLEAPLGSVMPVNKHSLITVLRTLGIIKDIKMRFLTPEELKRIQGFPENYKLLGSQKYQKKFIGNSVVPLVAKRILEALYAANYSRAGEGWERKYFYPTKSIWEYTRKAA